MSGDDAAEELAPARGILGEEEWERKLHTQVGDSEGRGGRNA